jgi:ADP-heptose:LPS heptosyltransferase
VRRLRSGFDLAVVLNTVSHSLTSDLIARFSGAKYILGSEHEKFTGTRRNFFYNLNAEYSEQERHQTERNLDIVRSVGAATTETSEFVCLTDDEHRWAREFLNSLGRDESRPLVAIHPGAGKPGNRWAVAGFAGVARELVRTEGVQIFVTWGPGEGDLGRELLNRLDTPALSVVLRDLRRVAALLAQARLVLCNDTGVMHLAAAVGSPLIAIFGPTDPALWKPLGEKFVAIRGRHNRCDTVEQELVLRRALDQLRDSGSRIRRDSDKKC